jgi:hypothetical protein
MKVSRNLLGLRAQEKKMVCILILGARQAGGGQTEKVPESSFVGEESLLSSNPAKDFALQGGHHSSKP